MVKKLVIAVISLIYLNGIYPVLVKKVKESENETDDYVLNAIHAFVLEIIDNLKRS